MKSRLLAGAVATVLATTMLVGCGEKEDPPANNGGTAATTTAPATTNPSKNNPSVGDTIASADLAAQLGESMSSVKYVKMRMEETLAGTTSVINAEMDFSDKQTPKAHMSMTAQGIEFEVIMIGSASYVRLPGQSWVLQEGYDSGLDVSITDDQWSSQWGELGVESFTYQGTEVVAGVTAHKYTVNLVAGTDPAKGILNALLLDDQGRIVRMDTSVDYNGEAVKTSVYYSEYDVPVSIVAPI